jgi:glycosyltransferase involved in cell wall biosynthesis
VNDLLLVAPGAEAPWTEGRKLFVRDIEREATRRGLRCAVIAANGHPNWRKLPVAVRELRSALRASPVGPIAIFPYGTFDGVRGFANRWFLRAAVGAAAGRHATTVLYSCPQHWMDRVARAGGRLCAVGHATPEGGFLCLGLDESVPRWHPHDGRRVLFLSGYQDPSRRSVHAVLEDRGLATLLDAFATLPGTELTVAIPFLRDDSARDAIASACTARGIADRVELRSEVDVDGAMREHALLAFPYERIHDAFVPTTLLEAFARGMPDVASERPMYAALLDDVGDACITHRAGDAEGLAAAIDAAFRDYAATVTAAATAPAVVHSRWNISRAFDALFPALAR